MSEMENVAQSTPEAGKSLIEVLEGKVMILVTAPTVYESDLYHVFVRVIATRLNRQLAEIGSYAVFGRIDQAIALMESVVYGTIDDLHAALGDSAIDERTIMRATLDAVTARIPVGATVYGAVDDDAAESGNVEVATEMLIAKRRRPTREEMSFAKYFAVECREQMAKKKSRSSS